MNEEIKIRYSKREIEKIKKKAKKSNLKPSEYQKNISKKAKITIELE